MKIIKILFFVGLIFVNTASFASYDAVFNKDCSVLDKPKSVFLGKPQSKGNACTVLEEKDDWYKIVYDSDKIGWVKKSDISVSNSKNVESISNETQSYKEKLNSLLTNKGDRDSEYSQALTYRKNGEYEQALEIFQELSDYKDSKKLYVVTFKEMVRKLKPGKSFKFGNFYENELEWNIVDKNNESALLLCKYSFKDKYDGNADSTSWSSCDLRKTLNKSFYEEAFNNEQKSLIMEVQTDQTLGSKKDNTDKVFCLGQRDMDKYSFILINSILSNNEDFWLRTTINDPLDANQSKGYSYCYYYGRVKLSYQNNVKDVRPAIRVTIK